ncbi:MAG: hypothetical protein AAF992_12405 [Bacteroidota bacterium]
MKKCVWLWLVLFTSAGGGISYGQDVTDSIPRHLKSKIRWMERQGFPASSYHWAEPEINLHLQQALDYRKRSIWYLAGGSGLMFVGTVLTTVGLAGLIVESTIGSSSLTGEPDLSRYNTMMIAGGISFGGGLTLVLTGGVSNLKKRKLKINQAKQLYYSP